MSRNYEGGREGGNCYNNNGYGHNNYNYNNNSTNNNNDSSFGYNNNNTNQGYSSRRSDGSYRSEIRVRPGYIPEAERQSYVPPPARTAPQAASQDDYEDLADRVDSWADEAAPVISDFSDNQLAKEVEEVVNKEAAVKNEVIETEVTVKSVINEDTETPTTTNAREPRKPSQLATAIDTALDSLSPDTSNSVGESPKTRPMGRFAAQIANDEREGRTYRNYRDSSYNRENRDGSSYNRGSSYNSNNWNRNINNNNNSSNEPTTSTTTITASPSSEIRLEKEFKSFLEQLTALRREMAVLNAKLEYIKYFKGLGREEMSETERERLAMEPGLIARMDAIFEAIDALSVTKQ